MSFLNYVRTALLLFILLVIINGCKKKSDPSSETKDPQTEQEQPETGQTVADMRYVTGEIDDVVNDIYSIIAESPRLSGNRPQSATAVTTAYCDINIDSSNIQSGKLVLHFNGTVCNNRSRTGLVTFFIGINMGNTNHRWNDTGSVIYADYDFTVARTSAKQFAIIKCQQLLTNKSGGSFKDLITLKSKDSLVTHSNCTFLQATFSDSSQASYSSTRQFVHTVPNNFLTWRTTGIRAQGGYNNLECQGQARSGNGFYSRNESALVYTGSCFGRVPISGNLLITEYRQGIGNDLHATFGVDAIGNAAQPVLNLCPYGWKLGWTYKSEPRSQVFQYY